MNQHDITCTPQARVDGLIVQELPGELLIYDQTRNKAHCLNRTAASVWRACDGRTPLDVIAARVIGQEDRELAEQIVCLALAQLERAHLLEGRIPVKPGLSRRVLLKRLGQAAAITLPIVASLLAPEAAQAGSYCASLGEMCMSVPCCTGLVCDSMTFTCVPA